MPRNYVCGIIRDPLKRFLVVHYNSASANSRIISVSAESWVPSGISPIEGLTTELRRCFSINSLDIFDIKANRTLTTFSSGDSRTINIILIDIREITPLKLSNDIDNVLFMSWANLLNAVNSKQLRPTTYSKHVIDRLYVFKDVV